ncbi:MAG: ADP-ribosylglycohydrolase family protein [Marmoricola sp.]
MAWCHPRRRRHRRRPARATRHSRRIARNFRALVRHSPARHRQPDPHHPRRGRQPSPTGADDDGDVVRPTRPHRPHRRQRLSHAYGAQSPCPTSTTPRRWSKQPAKVGALTHYDPHAQEACVLWSLAIRHAILHGELDVRAGLSSPRRRAAAAYWTERLDEAETVPPEPVPAQRLGRHRAPGRVVSHRPHTRACITALRASTSQDALATAIAIGDDTDTVAAIAGGLLGAAYGRLCRSPPGGDGSATAIPESQASGSSSLLTWPPTRDPASTTGRSQITSTTRSTTHPRHSSSIRTTTVSGSPTPPRSTTCPTTSPRSSACACSAARRSRSGVEHVGYRLIDHPDAAVNPNLDLHPR